MPEFEQNKTADTFRNDKSGSDVMFRADKVGNFIFVSEAAEELTGYPTAELMGRHFTVLIHDSYRRDLISFYINQVKTKLHVTHTEFAIACKDGTTKYVEQSVELDLLDGNVVGIHAHVYDITARVRFHDELQRSELRFRTVFESSPDAIFIEDLTGIVLDVNPAACNLHAMERDELIGKHVSALVPPTYLAEVGVRYDDLVDGNVERISGYSLRSDGESVPVDISASKFFYGHESALLLHVRDMSERIDTEAALVKSEKINRAIIQALPDLVFWISKEGRYLHYVAKDEEQLIVPPGEVIGNTVRDTFPEALYLELMAAIRKVLISGEVEMVEYSMDIERSNQTRFFEARIVPAEDETVLAIVRDITHERLLEHQVVYGQEDERRRIGQDLHDGLGSLMTGIAMLSRALEQDVSSGKPASAEQLEQIAKLASAGVKQARALAYGLNPVKLEDDGLIPALNKLAHDTEMISKIPVTIHTGDDLPPIDLKNALQVYWITREAITNAVKHASAQNISISLEINGNQCELIIADDGSGLPVSAKSAGMGVPTMKYRARLIGAKLELGESVLGGTEVKCIIPHC